MSPQVELQSRTLTIIESRVWQHINLAGAVGLSIGKLVADARLPVDLVLGAVLSLYTGGDIQCFLEAEDLRFVAR